MSNLIRRVKNLNGAIIEKLTELSDEGWQRRLGAYNRHSGEFTEFDPADFTVQIPNLARLAPPTRDNSDLLAARDTIHEQWQSAMRNLERQEADFIRDLTLQSVTSEAAREFIVALPTPEQLIEAPPQLTS